MRSKTEVILDPEAALATAARVLRCEAEAIGRLARRLDADFPRAVAIVASCAGKIAVTGLGKSGIICKKIAATLSSTGTPAIFLHAAEAMHGDLGLLGQDDVLLAVSKSGESPEILQTLNVAMRRAFASVRTAIQAGRNMEKAVGRRRPLDGDAITCGSTRINVDLLPGAAAPWHFAAAAS